MSLTTLELVNLFCAMGMGCEGGTERFYLPVAVKLAAHVSSKLGEGWIDANAGKARHAFGTQTPIGR